MSPLIPFTRCLYSTRSYCHSLRRVFCSTENVSELCCCRPSHCVCDGLQVVFCGTLSVGLELATMGGFENFDSSTAVKLLVSQRSVW